MDWMITYQDVRRNMCEAEKIYANDKVSMQRIKEDNEKKKLDGNKLGAYITNGKAVSVQMDGERKSHTSPTHTREQRAKIAGVSAGTVAYETKEEVIEWMFDIQLGRRNLSSFQRIVVVEKKRAYYEKKAKEKQAEYHGNQYDKKVALHQIWRKSKTIAQIMKQMPNLQR